MERIVLVHLSDIHVGSIRNGFYQPPALLAGMNGHDPLLLGRLQQALLNIPIDLNMGASEHLHVVVSGDLTCSGLATDFVLAHTYLLGELTMDYTATDCAGLQIPLARFWTVPGNHDHWNGEYRWPQPAYAPGIFGVAFEQTPWRHTLQSPKKTLRLDLFGIDSNSGLSGRPYNDTAYGELSLNELTHPVTGLETLLQDSDAERKGLPQGTHQVRGLLCHHSFSNNAQQNRPRVPGVLGWVSRSWNGVLAHFFGKMPDPLDPASVQALIRLAHQYDIQAVLTGHTHYFHDERFPAKPALPFVWELRSSTALQGPARDCEQGFYLHEISLVGTPPTPVWKYQRCDYSTNKFNPGAWATAD